MAVIASTGKERNWVAALRRVMDSAWYGTTNNAEQVPLALNNENILAVNAAGTGTVALIKANASDIPELPAGTILNAGTFNDTNGLNRFVPNSTSKTIVDGSATSLFDVACASGARCGGSFFYTIEVGDGTDHQAMTGMATYSAVNKAGTLTLTITSAAANDAKAVSSGTLTVSFTFVTGTSKGTVKIQPTGSLTETTYKIWYTAFPIVGPITIL